MSLTLKELRNPESSWAHIRPAMGEVQGEEQSRRCNKATMSIAFILFNQPCNPYGLGKLGKLQSNTTNNN